MTSQPHIPVLFTEMELTGLNSLPFPSNCVLTHIGLAFSVFLQHEVTASLPQSPVCSPFSQVGELKPRRDMWMSREAQGQPSFMMSRSPDTALRHSFRLGLGWGDGGKWLGWDLPETLVLSPGPHPSCPSARALNSKLTVQQTWGFGQDLSPSLKMFLGPQRSWSSVLAEPWVLGIEG